MMASFDPDDAIFVSAQAGRVAKTSNDHKL
jgi:hypothetical protein